MKAWMLAAAPCATIDELLCRLRLAFIGLYNVISTVCILIDSLLILRYLKDPAVRGGVLRSCIVVNDGSIDAQQLEQASLIVDLDQNRVLLNLIDKRQKRQYALASFFRDFSKFTNF